jgi:hypothetical protein
MPSAKRRVQDSDHEQGYTDQSEFEKAKGTQTCASQSIGDHRGLDSVGRTVYSRLLRPNTPLIPRGSWWKPRALWL